MKTLFQRPDRVDAPLYVVATVFNPIRYRVRWKLFEDFLRMCAAQGDRVIPIIVEVAQGERDFVITEKGNPHHVQLITESEVWLKECAQNIGLHRLPHDAKYVAFVDGDVSFARVDWADETVQQLQHYDVVQMFSEAYDLGPQHQIIQKHMGFAYCWTHGIGEPPQDYYHRGKYPHWHPGFGWSWRVETLSNIGGLVDHCILGSGDHHMAHALIGNVKNSIPKGLSERYGQLLLDWEKKAWRYVMEHQGMGYVEGAVMHAFHGPKASRRYQDRWQILKQHVFDPDKHLKRDHQGLWRWAHDAHAIRDQVRAYNRQRDEDGMFVDPAWSQSMLGK